MELSIELTRNPIECCVWKCTGVQKYVGIDNSKKRKPAQVLNLSGFIIENEGYRHCAL